MKRFCSKFALLTAYFLLASASRNEESISDHVDSASTIDLKRIPKLSADIVASESVARQRVALPEYGYDTFDNFESIPKRSVLHPDSSVSSNGILPETKKTTSKNPGTSNNKLSSYGYPYRMAPTLPPYVKHISDREEDKFESKSAIIPKTSISSVPQIPPMPRMPSMPKISAHVDDVTKRTDSLKKRQGLAFADISPDSREYSLDYSSYREPSYRNSHDLDFSPRKMYYESRGSYSRPSYSFPTLKPKLDVSPRDPYLSPSSEPIDGFYPKVKNNGASTTYSGYGKKDKYYNTIPDPGPPPSRAYGDDDDFSRPSSEEKDDFHVEDDGYGRNEKFEDEPSSYPDSYSEPAPKEPTREESHDLLYNSPITGNTRKRLLEYAGASDLYNGEPDYLKSAAIRKTKYSSIQDDYHPYPRSQVYSFSDYHFDESRRVPYRVKRQAPQPESPTPSCSKNATFAMCLTDTDYPTDEVQKIVSKNMKFLAQLRNTKLEINEKKTTNNDPESFEDLKKTQSVCSSKKGDVYPKKAKDVEGIWRIIINTDVARQSIEVDVCRSPETPCNYVPTVIPTKCVQKYTFVTLTTFNDKDNSLEHHDFPVPSSCVCSVGRPIRIRQE